MIAGRLLVLREGENAGAATAHSIRSTNGRVIPHTAKVGAVGGLPIPARGSVELKPGSYHVMLIGLKKTLTVGEKFLLTLSFEKAGNISVTVPVQAMGATQDKGGMGGMGHMEMK